MGAPSASSVGAAAGAVALLLLSACGPTIVYEESVPVSGEAWTYADSLAFAYEIVDTAKAYDLELTVEHTDAFATQNLYARFVTAYPSGLRESEPVSLELADRFGRWLGDCSGAECSLTLRLQEGARFPEPGRYGLTLHQYGRTESLGGVLGASLRIAEAAGPRG